MPSSRRSQAPGCAAPSVADLLVFAYGEGADAAVLVRGAPCEDAANGVITVRVPAGLATALSGSSVPFEGCRRAVRLATVGR